MDVSMPPYPVRLALWERALADASIPRAELAPIADGFRLGPARIDDAASEAIRAAALRDGGGSRPTAEDLRAAARAQSSRALHGLADKVEPVYSWEDIVLPARVMQGLRAVCASVTYRHVVYSEWGFDRRLAHGRGVNALFAGASGTGKTMASQIIARELGLDLYAIDLSTVVSKYIGETERNLRQIFRAAEWCNAILFFDEADALFGKRSEVRDAHDRYANIEVAFLLQQMEQYSGIVILATNLAKNLDDAFTRRMEHTLEFPMPDNRHRERIWRRIFPPEAPLAPDVDFAFLGQRFELSGGNIRNAALAAAYRAADAGRRIEMRDLVRGVARELDKLSQLPSRSAFGPYYDLILEETPWTSARPADADGRAETGERVGAAR
jgi:SpoVK/Ycf46/Vps4 family AAA+-type ATPase